MFRTTSRLAFTASRSRCTCLSILIALCSLGTLLASAQIAGASTIVTPTAREFLLVGRGTSGTAVGAKVSSSNSLGRIYDVPSPTNPDVDDNPPWPLPAGGTPPTGNIITNDGNVAVTHQNGTYDFSDIDIYADKGIGCVDGATTNCRAGWSNSTLNGGGTFFNDPTMMAAIEDELDQARLDILAMSETGAWSVSGAGSKNGSNQWSIGSDGVDENTTITLGPGENFIVIDTDGNDMKINNAGLVIDGPVGSSVIFVLESMDKNFLFENASITHGAGGIEPIDGILFAMTDGGNDTNFHFSKVIVNGAAFWDLSEDEGKFTMNNVQGCGQWIGDHLDFNDVQLTLCSFGIPEPSTLALFTLAFGSLLGVRRRS